MVQFEPSRCLRGYLLDAVGRVEKFTSGGVHGAPATVLHDLGRVEKGKVTFSALQLGWNGLGASIGQVLEVVSTAPWDFADGFWDGFYGKLWKITMFNRKISIFNG